jgi:three-Cys-motif partner protein
MPALEDYEGREQSYIKHVLLERYIEALVFKTASTYDNFVYVDGFAGPWQSANETFDDTSFGIALNALQRAKDTWKQKTGRDVKMTAILVEKDAKAFAKLKTLKAKYPGVETKPHHADFRNVVPDIMRDIPAEAFAYFLIDPKGWRIPLEKLKPMLARQKSEMTFNFMFEFINRAASMTRPDTVHGLDELIPYGNWRQELKDAEKRLGRALTSEERRTILVNAFKESLRQLGGYEFVAETPILRPVKDHTLYYLLHGTRHKQGLATFRDCQVKALVTQTETRGEGKVKHAAAKKGQSELFTSMNEMGPDKTGPKLDQHQRDAEATILEITPRAPATARYSDVWPIALSRHLVRLPDVNRICAELRKKEKLLFPDWEERAKVPKDTYRMQRPT